MRSLTLSIVLQLAASGSAGCSLALPGIEPCEARLLPGDLVITELMANPHGDESAGEWVEFANATARTIELAGVVLLAEPSADRLDGPDARRHAISGRVIEPGAYLAVGPGSSDIASTELDNGPGGDVDHLADSAGQVAIKCDVIEIDRVAYAGVQEGVALSLGATLALDHEVNDQPSSWCAPAGQYSAGNFGTPGRANDCVTAASDGMCEDSGTARPVQTAVPGDLVITEVMANPVAVGDPDGEWFEVYASRDVDLNGLVAGRDPASAPELTLEGAACLRVVAGTHIVFARNGNSATNGGISPVDHEFGFSLGNSRGDLYIGAGDTVIDRVFWSNAPDGASAALDPDLIDPKANDASESWCADTENHYGQGDFGTPGRPNGQCVIAVPGMCDDGGVMRAIRSPGPDQVTITEYMANPETIADSNGEWIEVYFAAAADLNGLELGREPGSVLTTVQASECRSISAGTHVVFARVIESEKNGGLPAVDALFDFGLVNASGSLFVGVAGEILDSLQYTGSSAGAAASLDHNGRWCANHQDPYGSGTNTGTPGAANPLCPSSATRK